MTREVGLRVSPKLDGEKWPPLPLMKNEQVIDAPVDRNELTRRLTEEALEFITEHQEQPFFLYFPQAMPGSTAHPLPVKRFVEVERSVGRIEELDWSTVGSSIG